MRVALYARYSDDKQNPLSVEDQLALCRRHAEARGWTIVAVFTDEAVSGSFVANRPGMLAAIQSAEAGAFDAVLVEHQDRMFRNLEQHLNAFNRLKRAGVYITTLTIDRVLLMHVAIEGLMSEMALEVLSDKTKRGMHSAAEKGKATGGKTFGYETIADGELAIVETERTVIVEAFTRFAAGETGREIANSFNRDGVPGPSGGAWNSCALTGSRSRANGILRNELYVGVKVWNRLARGKDPTTGRKTLSVRPEAEWKRTAVPHLAIIDPATWAAVQARFDDIAETRPTTHAARINSGLFTGVLKCGCCGANMISYDAKRLRCSTVKNKGAGACENGRVLRRAEVETRILDGLRSQLLSPEAVSEYVRLYHLKWQAKAGDRRTRRHPLERKLAETERAIGRLVDAIAAGADLEEIKEKLQALKAEKLRLQTELADIGDDDPVTLHPRLAEVFGAQVANLQARLAEIGSKPTFAERKLMDAIRALVDRITVTPISREIGAHVKIEVEGNLANFLRPGGDVSTVGRRLVAGGGIEPPTCGL